MTFGINHNLESGGETYHIQIEDHEKKKELEVRVYAEGRIIFQKLHNYESATMGLENPKHIEVAVKRSCRSSSISQRPPSSGGRSRSDVSGVIRAAAP